MGRKAKEVKEIKAEVTEVKETQVPIISDEKLNEIEANRKKREEERTLVNQLDTEKAKKDLLVKNGQDLIDHIKNINSEIQRLRTEHENRIRALKYVDDEIKAQNFALSRLGEQFDKKNAEKLDYIQKKQAELDKSVGEYNQLIKDVSILKQDLNKQLHLISEERKFHNTEMNRLNRHVQDVEGEDGRLRADIELREKKLKEEKEAFKAREEALQPELNKIEEIKHENALLWQKIEEEKKNLENQKSNFEAYKRKLDEDHDAMKASVKKHEESLKNEEAKLRKWQQDLEDFNLEIKAREKESADQKKRYQLHEKINS